MKVVIATSNKGKLREYKEMLEPLGFECLSLSDIAFDKEIVEDADTFKGNSYIKAKAVYDTVKLPTIADDSGLCVDALNGDPGVYSNRYSGEGHTDKKNRDLLINNLKKLNLESSPAHFSCAITYIDDNRTIQTEGYFYGDVILKERGYNGFGYDPIFYLKDIDKTVAELPDDEKNKISHRHNALIKLIEALRWERLYSLTLMEILRV